jgi:hypothetical protein
MVRPGVDFVEELALLELVVVLVLVLREEVGVLAPSLERDRAGERAPAPRAVAARGDLLIERKTSQRPVPR